MGCDLRFGPGSLDFNELQAKVNLCCDLRFGPGSLDSHAARVDHADVVICGSAPVR